ncbi:uncharacterized protein LOC100486434 isoform X1 [Xenopus tropicalis]|uniref:Uncharacterized protein LOC100486434 isoform X1 n=1 Tax=Xenopus tropicalis TaxID=8364 RepID=A0A8J0QQP2_XENTR|nr:uncharacterized protein LOC100486434 isoform X1 [Xenopus tropicalis]|eukprot:XP_002939217.1 PREDICTED: uncharacterized protein LOC100486434 isoform X1 [Xenopus tropicalis]
MPQGKQTVVGIFSRSGKEEYPWLVNVLRKDANICPRPFVITNSNASAFREAVGDCDFAILYHSMNRGRLNIADVTDSLYDEELGFLSNTLGNDKVLVIADDLEDSSDDAKNRILNSQPTIRRAARGIFLFSRADKRDNNTIRIKMAPIIVIITAAVIHKWTSKGDEEEVLSDDEKTLKPKKNYVSLLTHITAIACVANAVRRPSPRNWAFAFSWVAASLTYLTDPPLIDRLGLSESCIPPAALVTAIAISRPHWPRMSL